MSKSSTTWRVIADDLRAAITEGRYAPGERLPSRSQLMGQYGVASQTVLNALNALRHEGHIRSVTGSGYFVRDQRPITRLARTRLSRSERTAGRGTFTTDAHTGGWTSRVEVEVRVEPAPDAVADALKIQPGAEVLVRARVMYANDEPVQLATSYLPRDLTRGTLIEDKDTGPGGIYARLDDAGYHLVEFVEIVRSGLASETEATALGVAAGAVVLRIHRTAHTTDRVVETNDITALADRFELEYRLPTD